MFRNILPHNATLMWRLICLTDMHGLLLTQKVKHVLGVLSVDQTRPKGISCILGQPFSVQYANKGFLTRDDHSKDREDQAVS